MALCEKGNRHGSFCLKYAVNILIVYCRNFQNEYIYTFLYILLEALTVCTDNGRKGVLEILYFVDRVSLCIKIT
jgi:hypothetical protein